MASYFFVLMISTVLLTTIINTLNEQERRYVWLGYAAHAFSAVGQVVITLYYYGGGDMTMYHRHGLLIAKMVRERPSLVGELMLLTLGSESYTFRWVEGAGGSTGAMSGVAGWLALLLNDSLTASCLVIGIFAFLGQYCLYKAFKEHLPVAYHKRALIACFLVPSVVFWSSGILKEAIALGGLGIGLLGVSRLVKSARPSPRSIALLLVGFWVVGLVKAYILFPLAIASLIWFFAERSRKRGEVFKLRLGYLIPGVLLSVAVVAWLGSVYPRFAFEKVAIETAQLQGAYRNIDAGSSYELGDPNARTLTEQLQFAPVALISTLLRPFIFEVHNIVSLINALETSALFIMLSMVTFKTGLRRLWRELRTEPLLLFCAVYVVIFSVAVGLAAPNLGTLSRYRVPMFPAYWLLVLTLLPLKKTFVGRRPIVRASQNPN
jgi:hypothetical protein